MTKGRALQVLGSLSGGLALTSAAAVHAAWHRGHRRLSLSLALGGAAADSLLLASRLIPNFPLSGRVFYRGDRRGSSLALTFDDGPRPPHTERVLDELAAASVPATFFVLGENVRRYPKTVRRIEQEGHRVGNHGLDHSILMWAGAQAARRQVAETDALLRKAGVADPAPLFRAPHGWLSPAAHGAISSLGYRVAGWTKGVWDTENPGVDLIVERTAEVLSPGAILLLHDGWPGGAPEDRSQTVASLPGIIERARALGLKFVTVEQMMAEAGGSPV